MQALVSGTIYEGKLAFRSGIIPTESKAAISFLKEYFSYIYLKFGWNLSGTSAVVFSQAVDDYCVVVRDPESHPHTSNGWQETKLSLSRSRWH